MLNASAQWRLILGEELIMFCKVGESRVGRAMSLIEGSKKSPITKPAGLGRMERLGRMWKTAGQIGIF